MGYIYSAFIQPDDCRYELDKIKIIKEYDREIVIEEDCFVSSDYSTKHIKNYLDKELNLGRIGYVMYSKDYKRLLEWLEDKKHTRENELECELRNLKKTSITIKCPLGTNENKGMPKLNFEMS